MTEGNKRGLSASITLRSRSATSMKPGWFLRIFDFSLRGKGERNAFIDMGDEFVNMTLVPDYAVNGVESGIGFVVDDPSHIIELAKGSGARFVEGPFLDFLDPWGTDSRSSSTQHPVHQGAKCDARHGLTLAKNARRKKLANRAWLNERGDHREDSTSPRQKPLSCPGGGKHLDSPTRGRFFDLKLSCRDTGESITMFEETLPARHLTPCRFAPPAATRNGLGARRRNHIKIGDEIIVGGPCTCAFMPRDIPHALQRALRRARSVSFETPRRAPVATSKGALWSTSTDRRAQRSAQAPPAPPLGKASCSESRCKESITLRLPPPPLLSLSKRPVNR